MIIFFYSCIICPVLKGLEWVSALLKAFAYFLPRSPWDNYAWGGEKGRFCTISYNVLSFYCACTTIDYHLVA